MGRNKPQSSKKKMQLSKLRKKPRKRPKRQKVHHRAQELKKKRNQDFTAKWRQLKKGSLKSILKWNLKSPTLRKHGQSVSQIQTRQLPIEWHIVDRWLQCKRKLKKEKNTRLFMKKLSLSVTNLKTMLRNSIQ